MTRLQGGGLNGAVSALALSGDKLFVGGSFRDTTSNSGQGAFRGVVSYDTSSDQWSALKAGVDGAVTGLSVVGTQVIVTGNFTTLLDSAGGPAGRQAKGLATWNTGDNSWHQSGGFISGKLSFVGKGTSGASYVAGNVEAAVRFGSDGFVSLSNGDSKGPEVTALQAQLDSTPTTAPTSGLQARWADFKAIFVRQSSQTLPAPSRAAAPSILAGAYWGKGSSQVSIVAGNFSFTSGSSTARNVALYHLSSGAMEPLKGSQVNGTVYSTLVVDNRLFIGGQFSLENSAQGGNGFAIYDLDKQQWDSSAVDALQGSPVVVRSITTTPFKSNIVYVAGSFTGAGSLNGCAGICALDVNSMKWSVLGNGVQGEVAVVDYASVCLEFLHCSFLISFAVGPQSFGCRRHLYSYW